MNKYSRNNKLNNVLTTIENDLKEFGLDEVKRYFGEFKKESDFNIAQYGNLLIYYDDVRTMYKACGYTSTVDRMNNEQLWNTYKRQVGYVTRLLVKEF